MVNDIRYILEAAPAYAVAGIAKNLPVSLSSQLFGQIARNIGLSLPISRVASQNIQSVMPDKSMDEKLEIIKGVWENLGRLVGELPHIPDYRIAAKGDNTADIQVENAYIFDKLLSRSEPILYFSAHFGNWEVLALTAAHYGLPFKRLYRPANNPLVDRLIQQMRDHAGDQYITKSAEGSRDLIKAIKAGENVGFLLDQKLRDGVVMDFMGKPAKCPVSAVELAYKYDLAMVPAACFRLEGHRLRVQLEEPFYPCQMHKDRKEAVRLSMQLVNGYIEGWIRAQPTSWLWLHRRWMDYD
jgi:Kdo2-lipid IVA lauroyltransferase/acyltransferase